MALRLKGEMTSPATHMGHSGQTDAVSPGQGAKYKAFLSYSRADEMRAQRLQRQLERYRIPKPLRTGQAGIGAIFRDKDELSAASELDSSIKSALRNSENLIVLCSPPAAQSDWVDREVAYFKTLGREDRIFTVFLSGEPYAEKRGFDPGEECLPKSIRYDLTETGEIIAERAEPLATDLRPGGDGEKLGLLKLVSALMGIGLDRLLQRQLIRARRRMTGVIAGSAVLISSFAGLSWATYSAQKQAEARQADAENFVEFLLSDLSLELETFGRLDLLDAVGGKATDYYAQFSEGELDARASGRRARSLHFMGNLQNALAKTEESQYYFEQAYMLTEKGLTDDPENPDRIFEHAQSAYFKSLPLRRLVNYEKELAQLEEFATLSHRLSAREETSRSITQRALASMNIGRVKLRTDKFDEAKACLSDADVLFKKLNEADPTIQHLLYRTENLAWLAEYYRTQEDFEKSYSLRVTQSRLISDRLNKYPTDFRLIEASIYAELGLANSAKFSGRMDESKRHHAMALKGTQDALQLEPRREKMRRAQSIVLLSMMRNAVPMKDRAAFEAAEAALEKLQTDPLTRAVGASKYWNEILPGLIDDIDFNSD